MSLDSRVERIFEQSVRQVDDYLRTVVPGLEYPELTLRHGRFAHSDMYELYRDDFKRESLGFRFRYFISGLFSKFFQPERLAFVKVFSPYTVYYTDELFKEECCDDVFEYVFHHEVIHARHHLNSTLLKGDAFENIKRYSNHDALNDRDESLVECTMAEWYEVEDTVLSPLVRKRGLGYVWSLALNHDIWSREDFESVYL